MSSKKYKESGYSIYMDVLIVHQQEELRSTTKAKYNRVFVHRTFVDTP